MLRFIARRVLQFIPVFLGVTLILFLMTTVLGDPIRLRFGERAINPTVYRELQVLHGFDKPWYEQYLNYLNDLLHGDLGVSIKSGQSVAAIIQQAYPYTMKLAFAAIIIEIIVGVGAGMISAVKKYSFWDVMVTLSTSILVAMPVFWLGLLLQIFFGIMLKEWTNGAFYLPISGAESAQFPPAAHLILPAITLAAVSTAYAARIMRSQLLEVLNQDYIRTAHAKGLTGRRVLWGHGIKNAMIPVVTFIGLDLGAMLGGAILTETVFNWPGIGYTIFKAIQGRDYPVVFGGTVVILIAVMLVNLIVDISYAFLDPRIRYGGKQVSD
ncbi:MAG: ABC transporter permease [Coriobacteriia bacterium]|nr:ABC transporter permease [Coriobacteriia bacterium]